MIHKKTTNRQVNPQESEKKLPLATDDVGFRHDPISFCKNNLTRSQQLLLNSLIFDRSYQRQLYKAQSTLASGINRCRATANRALKKLDKLCLVVKTYRHKKTCLYQLSPIFKDPYIRAKLVTLFPALKFLPIAILLVSSLHAIKEQNVTQRIYERVNNSLYKITKSLSTDRLYTLKRLTTKRIVPVLYGQEIGSSMSTTNPIPDSIRKLTALHLTKWGQIKLTAFPAQVLEYAYQRFLKTDRTQIKDPFLWFVKVCMLQCQKEKIAPNWTSVRYLAQQYGMPDEAKMFFYERFASDNAYSSQKKNALSTAKSPPSIQTESNLSVYQNFQKGESSQISGSSGALSVDKTNSVLLGNEQKRALVAQESDYQVAKRMEESWHDPVALKGMPYLMPVFETMLAKLTQEEREQLRSQVHSGCGCPRDG